MKPRKLNFFHRDKFYVIPIIYILCSFGFSVQALSDADPRLEKLKFEVLKWANTLHTNSLDCQYKFEYNCHRDECIQREDMEAHYESSVHFLYQHPNQRVRIERIEPREGHYTYEDSAIYNGEVSKRYDFNEEFLGGFIKSPVMTDVESFSLMMLPVDFFRIKDKYCPPMEELFNSGTSSVLERDGFLVLSQHSEGYEHRSLDFFFDNNMQMKRIEVSERPPFKAKGIYPDPEILYQVWDADPFDLRALLYTITFEAYTEGDGVLFPIQINAKYWDQLATPQGSELRAAISKTENVQEKARLLCELHKLPIKVAWEYNISVEQLKINPSLSKSDFAVAFPAGYYVADWSKKRGEYAPPPPTEISPFKLHITAELLSVTAAIISAVMALFAFLIWLRRSKQPVEK